MCGLQGTTLQLSTYNTPALAFLGLCLSSAAVAASLLQIIIGHFFGEKETILIGLGLMLMVSQAAYTFTLNGWLPVSLPWKGHLHWTFDVSSIFPHEAPCTCGTIALLFLKVFLGLSVPHSPNVILDLRHLLLRSQPAICRSSELLIGLGPYPVEQQLAVLLQTKGFQLPERAAAAVQKLGAAADQAALQQKNPRKDLKLLTTKPGFGFQLVNKDELQQFIAPKAADQHGAVISSKKKQKPRKQERAGPSSRLPDPQQLQILPGHFVHRPGPGGSNVCRCHECSRQCRLLKGGSSPLQHRCVGTSCPGVRGYPC
jgi:hypothetical protein